MRAGTDQQLAAIAAMSELGWPDQDSVRWLPFDPGPSPVIAGIGEVADDAVSGDGPDDAGEG